MNWDWKKILGSIAAACVVILQIVNVLLTNDLEGNVNQKTKLMEQKAADLRTLIERNRADLETLHNELHAQKEQK